MLQEWESQRREIGRDRCGVRAVVIIVFFRFGGLRIVRHVCVIAAILVPPAGLAPVNAPDNGFIPMVGVAEAMGVARPIRDASGAADSAAGCWECGSGDWRSWSVTCRLGPSRADGGSSRGSISTDPEGP